MTLMECQVDIGADEAKAMVSNASTLKRKERLDELKYAYELETDDIEKANALKELREFLKTKE